MSSMLRLRGRLFGFSFTIPTTDLRWDLTQRHHVRACEVCWWQGWSEEWMTFFLN